MTKHETWWSTEGSGMRPKPDEDVEEFAKRITKIAWSNGQYVEREACAKVCDDFERAKWESVKHISENGGRLAFAGPMHCAKAIRERGKHEAI